MTQMTDVELEAMTRAMNAAAIAMKKRTPPLARAALLGLAGDVFVLVGRSMHERGEFDPPQPVTGEAAGREPGTVASGAAGPHRNFSLVTDALRNGRGRAGATDPAWIRALVTVLGEPAVCLCCGNALRQWAPIKDLDSYFCESCCPVCHDSCEAAR